jgi:hypothetical protein
MENENSQNEKQEIDKVELTGEQQPPPSSDQEPLLALNFNGRAKIKDERKHKEGILEFIPVLNTETSNISDEIKREIKSSLPLGLDVNVDIQFSSGSITWLGIVAVLDVVKNFNAGITFSKFLKDVVKLAINKVVRQRIEVKYQVKNIKTNVNRERFDPIHPITRFLWWCSGASTPILRVSPTETAKYLGIGGAVLTTGVLACISGGYAIYTMFEGREVAVIFGLLFGPIWGLIIFNLDRFIVSTLKKMDDHRSFKDFFRELLPAIPRFILAIILGLTISKPLELTFFHPEISTRIDINNDLLMEKKRDSLNSLYINQLQKLENERDAIKFDLTSKEARVKYLQDEYTKEMDSTGGSRRYGYSIVAQRKEAELRRTQGEYKQTANSAEQRINRLQSDIDAIRNQINQKLQKFGENLGKGFLARIRALSNLTSEEEPIRRADYAIILLLILIEIIPVLVKLLSPYGPYDAKLSLKNEAEVKEAEYKKDSIVQIAEYHYKSATEAEKKVEDVFHTESVNIRSNKIRVAWHHWDLSNTNGQGSTFEEFVEFAKDKFFMNRKP